MLATLKNWACKTVLVAGALVLTGCVPNRNEPPPPTSFEHPEIKAALETKDELQTHRTTLCSLNEGIDQVITNTVESVSFVKLDASGQIIASAESESSFETDIFIEVEPYTGEPVDQVAKLIESTRRLRLMTHQFLDEQDQYLASIQAYRQAAMRAPEEFQRAANIFELFAAEEPYEDFREDYLVMSQMFLSLADHYESQKEALLTEFDPEAFRETIAYLQRGALMLDRFEAALEIGSLSNELGRTAELIRQLSTVVKTFQEFRSHVRRVNRILQETDPASGENVGHKKKRDRGRTAAIGSSTISPSMA